MTTVWEILQCEEYPFQHSQGLFVSKERALQTLSDVALSVDWEGGLLVLVTKGPLRDSLGMQITAENLVSYTEGYDFYDIIHQHNPDYSLLGIVPREVTE